ncbi:MAG: hypothetical protein RLZZ502_1523, partial [Pseudomonadota bacterium]
MALFNRTPKWQHADPMTRVLAIGDLDATGPEIQQLLKTDASTEVRLAAAQRCLLGEALLNALGSESEDSVRQAIEQQLIRVLGSVAEDRHLLKDNRLPESVRLHLVVHHGDEDMQMAALDSILSEDGLHAVAIKAERSELRKQAAERLRSPSVLASLQRELQSKDQGLARALKARIEALSQVEQTRAEAEGICAELAQALEQAGSITSRVVNLDKRWQEIVGMDDEALLARHAQVRAAISARFEDEQKNQRQTIELEQRITRLTQAMAASELTENNLHETEAQIGELQQLATQLSVPRLMGRLQLLTQQVATGRDILLHQDQVTRIVAELEALPAEAGADVFEPLWTQWQALPAASRDATLTDRIKRVQSARAAFAEQAEATNKEASAALKASINEHLQVAEEHAREGRLAEAQAVQAKLKLLAQQARAAKVDLPKPTQGRMTQFNSKVAELRRWQQWGEHGARGQLIEQGQSLIGKKMGVAEIVTEVKRLREAWAKLDETLQAAPEDIAKQFEQAMNRAYAPAAHFYAEQAKERAKAKAERESFLGLAQTEVASFLAAQGEGWNQRGSEQFLRDIQARWRGLGGVEPDEYTALTARFKEVLAPVAGVLTDRKDGSKNERQALIDAALALASQALGRETPSAVKALQTKWQALAKSVHLDPKTEKQQWNAFRGACDAIFKARDAKRAEDSAAEEAQFAAGKLIIEELKNLHTHDLKEAKSRHADLRRRWQTFSKEQPKQAASLRHG